MDVPQIKFPEPVGVVHKLPNYLDVLDAIESPERECGPSRGDLVRLIADAMGAELNVQIYEKWKSKSAFARHLSRIIGKSPTTLCKTVLCVFGENYCGLVPLHPYLPESDVVTKPNLKERDEFNLLLRELPFEDRNGYVLMWNKLMSGLPSYWWKKVYK